MTRPGPAYMRACPQTRSVMAAILFVKTSSLGDVVHHLPAVTDARAMRPDARLAWLVEEAFAPLARLHPGIDEVIPVAWRRWRRQLHQADTWREIADFVRGLRARQFDAVVDTQGLLRTALITRLARGTRHGYDAASIREPLAALLYDRRHAVGRGLHAITRNRRLTALALGYTVEGAIDFGLDRAALAGSPAAPYAVLLHATAQAQKEWPPERWIALGEVLRKRGLGLVLPWGTPAERERSERIAAAVPGARVPDKRPLDEVARLIAGASVVIGVDTGLLHIAAALGVSLVAIFLGSEPVLTGPKGSGPIAVVGEKAAQPAVEEVLAALDTVVGQVRL
jgi:heptosyltransferase-1